MYFWFERVIQGIDFFLKISIKEMSTNKSSRLVLAENDYSLFQCLVVNIKLIRKRKNEKALIQMELTVIYIDCLDSALLTLKLKIQEEQKMKEVFGIK